MKQCYSGRPVTRTLLRFWLLLGLCVGSFGTAQAATELNGTDPELDRILSDYASARRSERLPVLERLGTSGREDTVDVLKGILEGTLRYHKRTGQVVWIDRTGEQSIVRNYSRTESVEITSKRSIKKFPLDNRLRGALRLLIAEFALQSPDGARRLAASEALLAEPAAIDADRLQALIDTEQDRSIRRNFERVRTLQMATADTVEARLEAIEALRNDFSPAARRAIRRLEADADPVVQETARLAAAVQQQRIALMQKLETVFFGLSLGSVLVLAAIGLSISFGVMGVINMAHGELIMLGAYTAWAMQQILPGHLALALLLSVPAAFTVSGITGVLIERSVVRFLYGRPLETLLATFGVSLVLQQAVRSFISAQNVPVANPQFMSGVLHINDAFSVTSNRVIILLFCIALFLLLQTLLRRSRLGLHVRAVAQDRHMARAMGVRASRVDALTFGLGAGIAGIAGVALSQLTNVGPNMGQAYIVDSFMVVVFGGVGNLWGTLVGGMTLGVLNKLLEPWAGAILAKIVLLVFLILFIQRRPGGLFPQRGRAAEAL